MRRSLGIAGLLFAWLCVNGALLDVVQVVAWGRMFAGYVRVLPIGEAWRRTFDPGRPCRICEAVQKARAAGHQERSAPAPSSTPRLLVFDQAIETVIPPDRQGARMAPGLRSYRSPPIPVPVPPPKVGACV